MTHPHFASRLMTLLAAGLVCALCGCQPYQLTGIVLPAEGDLGGVKTVSASDKRLERPGLAGASVLFTLDPDSMRPKRLGTVTTDSQGRFTLPVGETGAGFLEYDLGIYARKKGYAPTWQRIRLPGGSKQLIVLMEPGMDRELMEQDPIRETIEMVPPGERGGLEGIHR